jgi:hypothetical protein
MMLLLVTLNHAACDRSLFSVMNKQSLPQDKPEFLPICDHGIVWPTFCQTSVLKAKPAKSPVWIEGIANPEPKNIVWLTVSKMSLPKIDS